MTEKPKDPSPPSWPMTMSREARRDTKRRRTDFSAALKTTAKRTGWRFTRGTIFKQESDWYLSNLPSLAYQRGAIVRMSIKPMALDPLFWSIVGLEENNRLPLSFRATGAWTLRPPPTQEYVGPGETDPELLATLVIQRSEEWCAKKLPTTSFRSTLLDLGPQDQLRGQYRTIAICLAILMDDFETAARLSRCADINANIFSKESGGFFTTTPDGRTLTFLEQAHEWLINHNKVPH